MEVVVTTGAISHAKPQSNRHHQQTDIQHFAGGCPSNSVKATLTTLNNLTFYKLSTTSDRPPPEQCACWCLHRQRQSAQ